jgi:two-component system NtrC family response regulator
MHKLRATSNQKPETRMAKFLIIDDDFEICEMLLNLVSQMGHGAVCRNTLTAGLKEATSNSYDIVLLDVRLPDGSGLDILPNIRKIRPSPDVIILTGFGDADGAEIAIKYGAWDYIQKPASLKALTLTLQRIIQHRKELKEAKQSTVALKLDSIVGSSARMRLCYDLVAQAASSSTNVLITGETGTGKELFSRAIHKNSSRSDNGFVVVDCAALPETLVGSVLFGHIKGAFTGAESAQDGLVKQAHGGTLFLDEVGELPFSVQKVFLRVLQEQRFRPVGDKDEVKSNFRVIAATNRDLDKMVKSGHFRKDLLYRLKALTINLPPLRERPKDIIDIALFHAIKCCERNHIGSKGFSPEFLEALKSYNWPGNVRELVNSLETALITAEHAHNLLPVHLPEHIRIKAVRASFENQKESFADSKKNGTVPVSLPSFREFIESAECKYFQNLISHTQRNIKASCNISGLSRSRLYGLMKKHNLSRKF